MKYVYVLIGIALAAIGTVIRVLDPAPLPELRDAYFDLLQKTSPRTNPDSPIEIVAVDDASLAAIGQWPWPRSVLADLTNKLNDAGAAVVAFDILFAEQDRYSLGRLVEDSVYGEALKQTFGPNAMEDLDNDRIFAQAISRVPTVLASSLTASSSGTATYDKAGFVTIGQSVDSTYWPATQTTPVISELLGAASGVGVINTSPNSTSGVVRRVPLVWRDQDRFVPSFSIEALRVALGEGTFFLNASPDLQNVLESVRVGEFVIPTSSSGEFWVNYAPENPDTYLSAADILSANPETLNERIAGKIVFIGATAPGLYDIRTTSLGESVPGVSIHKQIIEQILNGQFLLRSEYQSGIEIILFVLLGIVVAVAISLRNSYITLISGLGAAGVVIVASVVGYLQQGVLLDITFPVLGGFVNFALMSGYQFIVLDRDKRLMRRSFEHYVAPRVLDEIERAGHSIGLSGENKEITVMFADIRGFTSFSESRDPQHVVTVLNDLFSRFTVEILETHGTVDKFVGDSIMAFWSAPIEVHDHSEKGLKAALQFREELARFNALQEGNDIPPLEIAIGLSSGMACVGNIGSTQRFSYTAIGKTVNLAARVEAACRLINYDIVCSEITAISSGFACLPAGHLSLKGFSEPIALYIVVGDIKVANSTEFVRLRLLHTTLVNHFSREQPYAEILDQCIQISNTIDPGLCDFYRSLPDRKNEL